MVRDKKPFFSSPFELRFSTNWGESNICIIENMMASQRPEIDGALLDPLEKTTTLTDWPSTTSEQHQSDYKPHVRCWVYRTVLAHGDRSPFSTGTPWRSQRLSFSSSDRKRTTSTVNGYKNENRLQQQLPIWLGGRSKPNTTEIVELLFMDDDDDRTLFQILRSVNKGREHARQWNGIVGRKS